MERNPAKEGRFENIKRASGVILLLVCACVIILALISDFEKNASDSLDYSSDKGVIYREAKYIFGSVINKDAILLTDDNVTILHKTQFSGTKLETLPYNSIKEITFGKAYGGYKIEITKASKYFGTDSYNFYMNQKNTFTVFTDSFKLKSGSRCPITEEL